MPRKARELLPVQLKSLRPGRHAVGGQDGLLLVVPDTTKVPKDGIQRTARTWLLRYSFNGKRRDAGLGGYPQVSLGEARERARKLRAMIYEGTDPIDAKRAARSNAAASARKALTFRKAAEQYIEDNSAQWKNRKSEAQWLSALRTYAFPLLGDLDVADIATSHVLDCLKPVWVGKTETASRLRGRIEAVIAYADKSADRERLNPARWHGHLDQLLPRPGKVAKVKPHAALPIDQMHDFMVALRQQEGQGAKALQFAILCAARSGEVRGATWGEIDLEAQTWTIPGERMKAGKPHRVPLSQPAIELLQSLS